MKVSGGVQTLTDLPPPPPAPPLCAAGESSRELGPPPSVDEAANTLMTRLGFLLGERASEGPSEANHSMDQAEAAQVGGATTTTTTHNTLLCSCTGCDVCVCVTFGFILFGSCAINGAKVRVLL